MALLQRPRWVELVIRQLKGDYALGRIPGHHFFANETYFHMLLLGYNLVNWFKRLCLPPQFYNATLETLRHQILLMPAQLVHTANRARLNLPASGHRQKQPGGTRCTPSTGSGSKTEHFSRRFQDKSFALVGALMTNKRENSRIKDQMM